MQRMLQMAGTTCAVAGVLVCLVTALARLGGVHYIMGVESITLFMGGIALMVFACLARLENLLRR